MFGLSLKEKITKQIAIACGNSAVRLKRDLINVYESNPNGNHQEDIVFLLDMFLTTVQVNVLDYYTEKYPQYEKAFNDKLNYWYKESEGKIQAGHLFDTFYSIISGCKADPAYCIRLNQKQRNIIAQVIDDIGKGR